MAVESEADAASRAGRRGLSGEAIGEPPPAVFPARLTLAGDRVALEPVDPRRHADGLFAVGHADDDARAVWTYLPYGPFADAAAMRAWLRECAAAADPVFLALRDTARGALMGMASFLNIRPLAGVAEIGHIWLAPPYQRTAEATEALYLMMRHVMDDLAYRRLEWKCNALNRASRDAALRLGFRFEGVFFSHMTPKGRNRDSAWYSIIAAEWPAVRANFEAWLAPGNFDADGRQRRSLGEINRGLWRNSPAPDSD